MKIALVVCLLAPVCWGQYFTQRGFIEAQGMFFPQTAPGDSGRAVGDSLLRYELFYKASPEWNFSGGLDARTDTHRQVEREWHLSWWDREVKRPSFEARRLSATYHKGKITAELGKQFIRWGRADILNPTDRFAPRDYLNVVDSDFLAVTAARLTYASGDDSLDLVCEPRFTPSRTPLLNQRWTVLPQALQGVPLRDAGSRFPGGPQFGARWNHTGSSAEYSLSFFSGFNHLPLLASPAPLAFERIYPQMRMYGGDAAIPLRFVTVKTEAAYFTSSTRLADEYAEYVIQLERQAGEWFFIGGYAGEVVTLRRRTVDFAPDRGLTHAILAHAGYTINTNSSIALETAIRDNGKGVWMSFEYSRAFGQHWRATTGFTWIHGAGDDFLGQYHRNSYTRLALRYSF
jgi:hypothetical protein